MELNDEQYKDISRATSFWAKKYHWVLQGPDEYAEYAALTMALILRRMEKFNPKRGGFNGFCLMVARRAMEDFRSNRLPIHLPIGLLTKKGREKQRRCRPAAEQLLRARFLRVEWLRNDEELAAPEVLEEEILRRDQMMDVVMAQLKDCSKRDQGIIQMRYLEGEFPTLEQVGAIFGLTRERIRQIERNFFKAVRERARTVEKKRAEAEKKAMDSWRQARTFDLVNRIERRGPLECAPRSSTGNGLGVPFEVPGPPEVLQSVNDVT